MIYKHFYFLFLLASFFTNPSFGYSYEEWKTNQLRDLEFKEIKTLTAQVLHFADLFQDRINKKTRVQEGFLESKLCPLERLQYVDTFSAAFEQEAHYAYNMVRELLDQPRAPTPQEIDETWIDEILEAAKPLMQIEKGSAYPPPLGIVHLLKQAQNYLGMSETVVPLLSSQPEGGGGRYHGNDTYTISLGALPDRGSRLFTVYHELAHVIYRDAEVRKELRSHDNDVPSPFLNCADLQSYLQEIESYKEQAKTAFDQSTLTGRRIQNILAHYTKFSEVPFSKKLQRTLTLLKGQESRADLFACKKLYEQGEFDAILDIIMTWASSGYIVDVNFNDEHPSYFERALYMAGFLIAQGIDINKALYKRENHGTCIPENSMPALHFVGELFPTDLNKGTADL